MFLRSPHFAHDFIPSHRGTGFLRREAADIIDRNGWHQGSYYDFNQHRNTVTAPEDCRVCAVGAIAVARLGPPRLGRR